MAAILELLFLPALIITLLVFGLMAADASTATIVAGAVVLGLLYFMLIKMLRDTRRYDHESEAADLAELKRVEREAELAAGIRKGPHPHAG